jgi:hypothetical protein
MGYVVNVMYSFLYEEEVSESVDVARRHIWFSEIVIVNEMRMWIQWKKKWQKKL